MCVCVAGAAGTAHPAQRKARQRRAALARGRARRVAAAARLLRGRPGPGAGVPAGTDLLTVHRFRVCSLARASLHIAQNACMQVPSLARPTTSDVPVSGLHLHALWTCSINLHAIRLLCADRLSKRAVSAQATRRAASCMQVFGGAAGMQAVDPAFAAAELLQPAHADGISAFAPDRRSVVGHVHMRLLDLVRSQAVARPGSALPCTLLPVLAQPTCDCRVHRKQVSCMNTSVQL